MRRGGQKPARTSARQGRKGGGRQMIPHPPQLPSYGIVRDVRMRFASNAAFKGNITWQNLLDTVLVATSATTAADLFESVRVNAVEVWAIAAVGSAATCTVVFDATAIGQAGDLKVHTDTSMGVEPAHVKARPDPLTQAGQFQASGGNPAFRLDVPIGAVIDVSLTMRQPVLAHAISSQNVLVGATTGAVYYRGLDGMTTSLTALPVQGSESVI